MSAPTLLISDLHLDAARPAATACLLDLLAGRARRAAGLWILGDLFEAWIGDDDDAPWLAPVLDALRALSAEVPVRAMHGNRDFLLGSGFTARTGIALVPEPEVVELGGRRTLLMHGDALCTDDHAYQRLRSQWRDPAWQREFLSRPLAARREFAAQARAESARQNAAKDRYLMDVNTQAVVEALRAARATRLIHGHTHRPATHALAVDGAACERLVLGDWFAHGWVMQVDAAGARQETLDF